MSVACGMEHTLALCSDGVRASQSYEPVACSKEDQDQEFCSFISAREFEILMWIIHYSKAEPSQQT